MANLKPTSFLREVTLKEAIISPEVKPGVIITYLGADYVVIKPMDNALGWVMYSDRPAKRFHQELGGVGVEFGDELYSRPVYLATKKSLALVAEILNKIKPDRPIKKGNSIPAESGPTEIMQFVRDGKVDYEDAIQFMSHFDPRWMVTVARHFKKPSFRVEETLIKGRQSGLLADYAIRAVGHKLDKRAEDVIALDPKAWQTYTTNLKR